jgi:hypothetical protein
MLQTDASLPERQAHVYTMAEETGIPGLHLYSDFVTEAEEYDILRHLESVRWTVLAKREVCHFGYAFDYLVQSTCPLRFALSHYG